MKTIFYPQPLSPGDAIAIISPAGSVTPDQLESGLARISLQGYEPVLAKHVYSQHIQGYSYAGTEAERTADLNWALTDPEIKAIWASRGGYGGQHLLPEIKSKAIKQIPKWYIGYSDNTVIQSFLLKQGVASIHGQTVKTSSFGVAEDAYAGIFSILEGTFPFYDLPAHPHNRAGEASGILVGGNLALVYALLGTRYSFKFRNRILFLEDIGENYYALDRMLMALEAADVFDDICGLIIGGMTNMGSETENPDYAQSFDHLAYEIIAQRVKEYDFPVQFGFPNGHIYDNRPLVIGAMAELHVGTSGTLKFI